MIGIKRLNTTTMVTRSSVSGRGPIAAFRSIVGTGPRTITTRERRATRDSEMVSLRYL